MVSFFFDISQVMSYHDAFFATWRTKLTRNAYIFRVKSEESRAKVSPIESLNLTGASEPFSLFGNERGSQLWTYGVLFGLLVIASLVRTIFYFIVCMKASVNLHERLFSAVLRAPIKFFEDHSIGELNN
jgi:ABC-type multidrug transport system fused ATPase/permease subunit